MQTSTWINVGLNGACFGASPRKVIVRLGDTGTTSRRWRNSQSIVRPGRKMDLHTIRSLDMNRTEQPQQQDLPSSITKWTPSVWFSFGGSKVTKATMRILLGAKWELNCHKMLIGDKCAPHAKKKLQYHKAVLSAAITIWTQSVFPTRTHSYISVFIHWFVTFLEKQMTFLKL